MNYQDVINIGRRIVRDHDAELQSVEDVRRVVARECPELSTQGRSDVSWDIIEVLDIAY